MQLSIKNLSIRAQVLLPVAMTTIFLLIALWITQSNLQEEQETINSNSDSLIFYKDKLAHIDDMVYPLRINAVYAIYDPSRRDKFAIQLAENMRELEGDLDEMARRETFRSEVAIVREAIRDYVDFSHRAVTLLGRYESGLVSEQEYQGFIGQYRDSGNRMVQSINELSQIVNQFAKKAMEISEQENDAVQTKAVYKVLIVLVSSIVIAWFLSGLIVTPVQALQSVMRKIAQGDLTARAEVDGKNEIAQLGEDVNQTIDKLSETVEALTRISEEVASASTELAAVMNQAESNAQQELREIEQVASAVNELASTADNVSDNASMADSTARETDQLAKSGLSIFEESKQSSEQMKLR